MFPCNFFPVVFCKGLVFVIAKSISPTSKVVKNVSQQIANMAHGDDPEFWEEGG